MNEPDWDQEQHRLLAELSKIDMPEELWRNLSATLSRWVDEQRESDRRWRLHEKKVQE
jgi:hexokinase